MTRWWLVCLLGVGLALREGERQTHPQPRSPHLPLENNLENKCTGYHGQKYQQRWSVDGDMLNLYVAWMNHWLWTMAQPLGGFDDVGIAMLGYQSIKCLHRHIIKTNSDKLSHGTTKFHISYWYTVH